jgi:hypothetical protein
MIGSHLMVMASKINTTSLSDNLSEASIVIGSFSF